MKLFSRTLFCFYVLMLVLLAAGCGKKEYSVKDFADVTVIGYTEHGSLSIKVNDATVNGIYADGKKDKTAALRFAETFRFSYDGQDSEDSYFTNGDVVTINVSYDESMARSLGISFVDSSFDYKIDGLEDKVEASPFDGLNVSFSGVAPYGTVQLDKSNCSQYVIDNVTFECSNYDLSNGDSIIVKAEFNSEIAERNGYVFTETAKKYKVIGLSKYVTTMMGVTYSPVSAKMRYMVEQFVEGSESSYKSLKWYFGDEDSDSDGDGYIDEDETASSDEFSEDSSSAEEQDELSSESGESGTASSKKKRKTDVQRIKDDFALSDFKAKFEYTPVECFYSLNPLQYSDNIFSSAYKIKGTFVCESTAGSGYINPGDTVVGEIYVTASLTGGSVDIKNNLVYEDTTLENYHAYSIRSYPEYKDMSADIFKSTTYVVEKLDYIENQEAYDSFVQEQATKSTRSAPEVAHITIESDTDSDKKKKKRSSSDENASEIETDTDTELTGEEENPIYFEPDDGEYDDGFSYDDGEDGGDEE